MLAGLFRSHIFTRIFTPAEYGYYSLVYYVFNFLSVAFFSYLANCYLRFYHQYQKENNLKRLNTLTFYLFLVSIIVLLIPTLTWYNFASNRLEQQLVLYSFLYFLTLQMVGISLIPLRMEGYSKVYSMIQSFKALLSFGFLLYLTFILDYRIEALLLSNVIINMLFLFFIIIYQRKRLQIMLIWPKLKEIKDFMQYGITGILTNISILVLISSDRYIIRLFGTLDEVGIYNQVYNLGEISIVTLVYVFQMAVSPVLLHKLENNFDKANRWLQQYLMVYFYLLIPVTVFLAIFKDQIAFVLLGEKFRVANTMIPWIMASSFLYGISLFHESKLKFAKKYRVIVSGFALTAILNVVLNFLLIPVYGYRIAALTTLGSYMFLVIFMYLKDSNPYLKNREIQRILIVAGSVLMLQFVADYFLRNIMGIDINIWMSVLEGLVFVGFYLVFTFKVNPLRGNFENLFIKPDNVPAE